MDKQVPSHFHNGPANDWGVFLDAVRITAMREQRGVA